MSLAIFMIRAKLDSFKMGILGLVPPTTNIISHKLQKMKVNAKLYKSACKAYGWV